MLVAVAAVIALAAALRSTWSPCGLSMLSSITPISERAKGHRYGVTCAWFVAGAVVGGATLGLASAGLAAVVGLFDPSPTIALALAALAAATAAASDAPFGFTLPFHRRQVNEDWLDQYRPWVYAGGFGWQIGVGYATYITTAGVHLVVVLGALTGQPLVAGALATGFGLVRGLAVLLTRSTRTPAQLLELHARIARAAEPVRLAVACTLASGAVALAAAAAGAAPAVAVGAAALTALVALALAAGPARRRAGLHPAA